MPVEVETKDPLEPVLMEGVRLKKEVFWTWHSWETPKVADRCTVAKKKKLRLQWLQMQILGHGKNSVKAMEKNFCLVNMLQKSIPCPRQYLVRWGTADSD